MFAMTQHKIWCKCNKKTNQYNYHIRTRILFHDIANNTRIIFLYKIKSIQYLTAWRSPLQKTWTAAHRTLPIAKNEKHGSQAKWSIERSWSERHHRNQTTVETITIKSILIGFDQCTAAIRNHIVYRIAKWNEPSGTNYNRIKPNLRRQKQRAINAIARAKTTIERARQAPTWVWHDENALNFVADAVSDFSQNSWCNINCCEPREMLDPFDTASAAAMLNAFLSCHALSLFHTTQLFQILVVPHALRPLYTLNDSHCLLPISQFPPPKSWFHTQIHTYQLRYVMGRPGQFHHTHSGTSCATHHHCCWVVCMSFRLWYVVFVLFRYGRPVHGSWVTFVGCVEAYDQTYTTRTWWIDDSTGMVMVRKASGLY